MVYTTKEETGHEENCSCNLGAGPGLDKTA